MGVRGRLGGRIFESGGLRENKVLSIVSKNIFASRGKLPLLINITPDQSVGSPGVRLMYTPWGQADLRAAL